jgi:hypothetical protein
VTWGTFEAAAPELALEGRRLIYRGETGEVLLATVRDEQPPRIHPIWVAIVGDRLYAFILRGPKRVDLERDGRYAMHTHQDPLAPSEFSFRGRARLVTDDVERAEVAGAWYFEADDSYGLFEFSIETAVLGRRATADDWPPQYTTWAAAD